MKYVDVFETELHGWAPCPLWLRLSSVNGTPYIGSLFGTVGSFGPPLSCGLLLSFWSCASFGSFGAGVESIGGHVVDVGSVGDVGITSV